jgi:GT2 family glycosyltransferase
MRPRVSVLLPVRNGMPWLREALASLAQQTFRDFEVLVMEDGSTDATLECLATWPDARLRVIPTGGAGIAAALTTGLDAARAPLVARQDADDLSMPDRLQAQVKYLDEHPDVGLVASRAEYIDERGAPVDNGWVRTVRRQQDVAVTPRDIQALMPLTCCLTHGSVMARAEVLCRAGGYRQEMAPAEDYDLWLRLLPTSRLAKLPERLYQYRIHDGQVSILARDEQIRRTIAAKLAHLRRSFPELPLRARLAILGGGRGDAYYRAVAPEYGFDPLPALPARAGESERLSPGGVAVDWAATAMRSSDALVVTDFTALEECHQAIARDRHGRGASRLGNFFVAPRRPPHAA